LKQFGLFLRYYVFAVFRFSYYFCDCSKMSFAEHFSKPLKTKFDKVTVATVGIVFFWIFDFFEFGFICLWVKLYRNTHFRWSLLKQQYGFC
jgi:hypothetical protein